eukprot:CAMPEP_0202465856 /NCGR_PEP_ID=MMETSP1360-20130828/66909_1 /ASSEMBLY_ACC=CAM_ASM_000848 /TAXON_ID=515479 /ORGANISM="Licmophora paradoxa, Strain CCMP2313" /LENGTH=195 /DNA_ID=CAMNT_0049089777 /DNA_START=202 /DNA_END=785 /DNA_ORIENTATION=-
MVMSGKIGENNKRKNKASSAPQKLNLDFLQKYAIRPLMDVPDPNEEAAKKCRGVDYEPTEYDVICGKGKRFYTHSGNARFREFVQSKLGGYQTVRAKYDKGLIVQEIVDMVQEKGAFLRMNKSTKCWEDISADSAREKVGHTIRDALGNATRRQVDDFAKRGSSSVSGMASYQQIINSSGSSTASNTSQSKKQES